MYLASVQEVLPRNLALTPFFTYTYTLEGYHKSDHSVAVVRCRVLFQPLYPYGSVNRFKCCSTLHLAAMILIESGIVI